MIELIGSTQLSNFKIVLRPITSSNYYFIVGLLGAISTMIIGFDIIDRFCHNIVSLVIVIWYLKNTINSTILSLTFMVPRSRQISFIILDLTNYLIDFVYKLTHVVCGDQNVPIGCHHIHMIHDLLFAVCAVCEKQSTCQIETNRLNPLETKATKSRVRANRYIMFLTLVLGSSLVPMSGAVPISNPTSQPTGQPTTAPTSVIDCSIGGFINKTTCSIVPTGTSVLLLLNA